MLCVGGGGGGVLLDQSSPISLEMQGRVSINIWIVHILIIS